MSSNRNNETKESLKQELKVIQAKCIDTYQTIENAPPDDLSSNFEEKTTMRINNYIEGLRIEVLNSNTTFSTDDNLLTSQFLIEMDKKIAQVEDMVAFTKGNIHDMESEINRIQALIDVSKEAKLIPQATQTEVKPEHIQKATERFQMMKSSLRGLIQSLFPNGHEMISEFLGELMAAKMKDPNGYIKITADTYKLIEILKDMNIVTCNPYNNMEVKLAY